MLVEIFLGVLVAVLLWFSFFRKPDGLPPGRWGLPLIGYIPLTGNTIEEQAKALHKQYGDICIWRMGTRPIVFIQSFELTKEVFGSKLFMDRPSWDLFTLAEKEPIGLFAVSGYPWLNNRRFTVRQLRDQGMGKSRLVSAIQDQAHMLVDTFKLQANKPTPMPHALRLAVTNVIWNMISGKTFKAGDKDLQDFEKTIQSVTNATARIGIPDFFPWLKHLPQFLLNRLFYADKIEFFKNKLFDYFMATIEEHKAALEPDNPKDLIDAYLLEMKEQGDSPDSLRSQRDLTFLIFDLFFAGSDTVTNTFTHLLHYMAAYPEVQRKLQEEIDDALPKGSFATLEDRARLPYTEAVINEVLRITSLAPLGTMHCASEDTQLGGYSIPKGTVIVSGFADIHANSRHWEEADKFLPERWIDEEGKFKMAKEGFLPFGIGRRTCIGENLARMELLIFTTAFFQKLNIAPPPGTQLDLTFDTTQIFFNLPKQQDVLVTIR